MDGLFSLTLGHITFKDTPPGYCKDAEVLREDFLKRYQPAEFVRSRFLTHRKFLVRGDWTPEKNPDDLPDVRIVHQQRVTVTPDDGWERDGEPYVNSLTVPFDSN
jgi:hypothetical protein